MAVTVDTFGNLTAQQKLIVQGYFDFAATLESSPVPVAGQTMQQARAVDNAMKELITWCGRVQLGARYVMAFRRKEASDAFEANTQ